MKIEYKDNTEREGKITVSDDNPVAVLIRATEIILNMMQNEDLIEGLVFAEMWDGDLVLGNSVEKAKIMPEGIQYLQENSTMQRVGKILKEGMDTIAKLAGILLI